MYTSGRTVKSSKPAKPSTVASATRDARKLIARIHPTAQSAFTVNSTLTADLTTMESRVRTTITFPESSDASDLACAVEGLTGYVGSTWSTVNITITRRA